MRRFHQPLSVNTTSRRSPRVGVEIRVDGERVWAALSEREETLRNMRWTAQLSASDRPQLAILGVAEVEALLDSDLLEESEKVFFQAALGAVYEHPGSETEEWWDDADVEFVTDADATVAESDQAEIPGRQRQTTEEKPMTEKVVVSNAQKSAAQAMVKRSSVTGRDVSKSVHKIATAKPVSKPAS